MTEKRRLPEQQAFTGYNEQPQQRQRNQREQSIIRPGERQTRSSHRGVVRLDGRQAAQRTHSTRTREDWQNSTSTVFVDTNGRVTELDDIEQELEDDGYNGQLYTRLPTSARKINPIPGQRVRYEFRPETVIRRRASAQPTTGAGAVDAEDVLQAKPRRQRHGLRAHPLLYLGIGMVFALALWVGIQWIGAWWQLHQDDATYGRPRTFQFDAVFGHSDSAANPTHIIIVNLSRHIVVIELPGGDPGHARIYSGPTLFGDGLDLTPVTGRAIDVNGDGKLDLVLYVQDQRIVFINDNGQFRPLKPREHITIPQ